MRGQWRQKCSGLRTLPKVTLAINTGVMAWLNQRLDLCAFSSLARFSPGCLKYYLIFFRMVFNVSPSIRGLGLVYGLGLTNFKAVNC